MKIYTKTGDKGETSLVYGLRVSKRSARVEAYGTCDEANSMIGLGLSLMDGNEYDNVREWLFTIQTKLFHVGSELATPPGKKVGWPINEEDVEYLENAIDNMEKNLPELKNFILPGGSKAGSAFHVARTIARRAERSAVAVQVEEELNPIVVKYLNRLSDFLFVVARYVNHLAGNQEPDLIT